MSVTYVGGVDPGLVHTGVVGLAINPHTKGITVKHTAIAGPDAQAVRRWFDTQLFMPNAVFIEKYQPRSHFGTDPRMMQAVAEMKAALPNSEVLLNTGVKKVVRRKLMQLLGMWQFSTTTHHQDVRSAARILLYGMLKDELMNKLIADIVRDHLEGRTWDVDVV